MQAVTPIITAQNIPKEIIKKFHIRLLSWFKENGRSFPWRETKSPYEIIISELLLQKTNSRAVSETYLKFLKKYPSPAQVTKSSEAEIYSIISPLGLFYRAERILAICSSIEEHHEGEIPNDITDLMKLKGIGRYAASAVLCFGFGESVAILDRNVIRILSRVFDIRSNKPRSHIDNQMWEAAQLLLPADNAREYNLALLDLSAIVCKPKPDCNHCPLNDICAYSKVNQI